MLAISRVVCVLVLVAVCIPLSVFGQSLKTEHTVKLDEGAISPLANIEQMSWMAGAWQGEAFGGTIDEVWSPPAGGAMMGMFRLVQGDETGFYELMTLVEESGSLVFRLKHFNADLKGWEEKDETVDFPLVALEENVAFFDGITFQRADDTTLNIYLASENKEGGFDELVFNYKKNQAHP